jgi:hypothetical protein
MPPNSDTAMMSLYYRHHRRRKPEPTIKSRLKPLVVAISLILLGAFTGYQHTQWNACRQSQNFAACWVQFH